MKTITKLMGALAFTLVTVTGAQADPAPTTLAPATTPVPATITVDAAQETSALFFSTCVQSLGKESEFTKSMKALADTKTAVKMDPDKVKMMVNEKEAKNAWGVKGFNDANKPLLLTYNSSQNVCGMHVSDVDPVQMRHAFQADLKKLADLDKATVKVYKPQTNGDINVFAVDVTSGGKTMQLGLAISAKTGSAFLTTHM